MPLPLTEQVLRRLAETPARPVSGEELARSLGVTRSAVWKAVEGLRRAGYSVASLPGRGYRLDPDRRGVRPGEVLAHLTTRRLGRAVRHFESVDSTNRQADRWAEAGAPEGALVVADQQLRGRGRRNRSWYAHPGGSLLLSLVLRPRVPAGQAPLLTYAAAAALAGALARWVEEETVAIKWPNDVLLGGRKVAGILLEMRTEGALPAHVVVGVGVNVQVPPGAFPAELAGAATSVSEWCAPPGPDRLDVLCAFLERFEALYDAFGREGFTPVRAAWKRWFRHRGRPVRIHAPSGLIEGRALGLDEDGAFLVERPDGSRARVVAGDLELASTREP